MSSRFRFGINYKMGITFCKNKKQDEEVGGEELLKEIKEIKKQNAEFEKMLIALFKLHLNKFKIL